MTILVLILLLEVLIMLKLKIRAFKYFLKDSENPFSHSGIICLTFCAAWGSNLLHPKVSTV